MIKKLFILTIALGLIASCAPKEESGGSKTLKEVQSRGILKCGVSQGLPGFSNADDQGQWSGLELGCSGELLVVSSKFSSFTKFCVGWFSGILDSSFTKFCVG